MSKKHWIPLENNPEVFNFLAHTLGLQDTFAFHEVYSFDEFEVNFLPRPCHAVLAIIPLTEAWNEARTAEDKDKPDLYVDNGDPVLWFTQTIGNACGSIGMVHCLLNGEANKFIRPNSALDMIRKEAIPKKDMLERAKVLEESTLFEAAHKEAAAMGDTQADEDYKGHMGQYDGAHHPSF
jgi:ubiquitin carboxyl-terminal hydrolase L3